MIIPCQTRTASPAPENKLKNGWRRLTRLACLGNISAGSTNMACSWDSCGLQGERRSTWWSWRYRGRMAGRKLQRGKKANTSNFSKTAGTRGGQHDWWWWKSDVEDSQLNLCGIYWRRLDWSGLHLRKAAVRRPGEASERASCWLWHKRDCTGWKPGGEGQWPGQSLLTCQLEGVVVKDRNTQRKLGTTWRPFFQAKASSIRNRCMLVSQIYYTTLKCTHLIIELCI